MLPALKMPGSVESTSLFCESARCWGSCVAIVDSRAGKAYYLWPGRARWRETARNTVCFATGILKRPRKWRYVGTQSEDKARKSRKRQFFGMPTHTRKGCVPTLSGLRGRKCLLPVFGQEKPINRGRWNLERCCRP